MGEKGRERRGPHLKVDVGGGGFQAYFKNWTKQMINGLGLKLGWASWAEIYIFTCTI